MVIGVVLIGWGVMLLALVALQFWSSKRDNALARAVN
jgi:hypothetical protein